MSTTEYELNCPHCNKLYKLPHEKVVRHAGKSIHCKRCGKPFSIPHPPEVESIPDEIPVAIESMEPAYAEVTHGYEVQSVAVESTEPAYAESTDSYHEESAVPVAEAEAEADASYGGEGMVMVEETEESQQEAEQESMIAGFGEVATEEPLAVMEEPPPAPPIEPPKKSSRRRGAPSVTPVFEVPPEEPPVEEPIAEDSPAVFMAPEPLVEETVDYSAMSEPEPRAIERSPQQVISEIAPELPTIDTRPSDSALSPHMLMHLAAIRRWATVLAVTAMVIALLLVGILLVLLGILPKK